MINSIVTFFFITIMSQAVCTEKLNKGKPTEIRKANISATILPPGAKFRIGYNWGASPSDSNYNVWVNIMDLSGNIIFDDNHTLPYPINTSTWSGDINYTHLLNIPYDLKDGTYTINAGLFNKTTGCRLKLKAGTGVICGKDFNHQIGSFIVNTKAPLPPLDSDKKETLNLEGYEITFMDEFDGPLDVSAWGPGTKWIAHTPYNGDFGDSDFANPRKDFPFHVNDGILSIEARKDSSGKWESGLLCSVDTKGEGFSQQYGYFEMRAKFPQGPGTWPAFWLLALQKLKDSSKMGFEVDIVEQYGRNPSQLHCVLHWWYPDKSHESVANQFIVEDMSKNFHTYGFMWDEEKMIWYFNGIELWQQLTPPESKTPMYLMLNLALGPGWPIDKTPNPSYMLVDYVKVYKKIK